MIQPIEILVHISGPSRGADDARYRGEARGLLDFEPVRRQRLLSLEEGNRIRHEQRVFKRTVHTKNETPVRRPAPAVNDLPSSLLERLEASTPYGTTAETPMFKTPFLPVLENTKDPSALPATAEKPIPKLLIERTPALPRRCSAPQATTPTEGSHSHRRTQSDSWKTPPSVIPDSQHAPSSNSGLQISSSICLKRPFVPSSSPSPTSDDEVPEGKRRCGQQALPFIRSREAKGSDGPSENSFCAEDTGEKRRRPVGKCYAEPSDGIPQGVQATALSGSRSTTSSGGPSAIASSAEAAGRTAAAPAGERPPLEIHPPRPQSSTTPFTTHLTPSLQTLSTQLPLPKYFTPALQTRPLEKLERGHWLFPITTWEQALKTKFWQFLSRFVGEGRAGWGVWCNRELHRVEQSSGSNKENRDPGTTEEIVKVYGWGEIVGEVWLVLFLASERKIKGLGARWVDAGGETVVLMSRSLDMLTTRP